MLSYTKKHQLKDGDQVLLIELRRYQVCWEYIFRETKGLDESQKTTKNTPQRAHLYNKKLVESIISFSLTSEGGVLKLLKASWVLVGSQLQISSKSNVIMHIDLVVKCDHVHWSRTSNTPQTLCLPTYVNNSHNPCPTPLLQYRTQTTHCPRVKIVENKLIWNLWGGGTLNDHNELNLTKP